mgnify:CR=1 FL=1|tara:strand:- start:436 stop:1338 length:903 start_codon:yes stop_codon:yes gene_type:complete
MTGRDPYKPFENTKVKWIKPKSEVGAPLLAARVAEEFTFRRPAALVFLGNADASNCCAANYERIVFMDKKVLKLTKAVLTLRIDRSTVDAETLERYGVQKNKPAIVVTDCEGEVVKLFNTCVNARDVAKAMVDSIKLSKKKRGLAKKVQGYLAKAEKLLAEPKIHEATLLFRKVLNVKGAPAAGYERSNRVLKELHAEGQRRFDEAKEVTSPTRRFDQLIALRHDFVLYEGLIKPIRAEVVKLEEGEKTKDLIFVHKGMREIGRALEIKDGKRQRTILRDVRFKWKGTAASERAAELLEK